MSVMTAGERVPTQFRAELSADTDPATGWRVVDDDGLLCMYCSQREAEMIAEACNNYHALQQRAAQLEAREKGLVELLCLMYDKWENGTPCYEDPEDYTGSLGNAFKLTDDEETRVLAALEAAGIKTALTFARAADRAALAAGGTKP